MWFICTVEYDLAINGNEVLMHGTTQRNPGNIMLRERSRMVVFIGNVQNG